MIPLCNQKCSRGGEGRVERRPPQTSRRANIKFKMANEPGGMEVNKEGRKGKNGRLTWLAPSQMK